jgi:hypothetical protein
MKRAGIPILAVAPVAAAAILAGAAGAAAPTITVTASTHAAKAQSVRFVLTLRYRMQCGYPGVTPLVVTLPGAVPARVSAASVLVDDQPARGVTVRGHRLTISLPERPGVLCHVIGPGTLKVVFTAGAKLANPPRAGSYTVLAVKGTLTAATRFVVR